MQGEKTININGRDYDAVTGMPINKPSIKQTVHTMQSHGSEFRPRAFDIAMSRHTTGHNNRVVSENAAMSVHRPPERSTTLLRSALRKPVNFSEQTEPKAEEAPQVDEANQNIHITHPIVERAINRIAELRGEKPAPVQTSKELKEMLIKERLAEVASIDEPEGKTPLRMQPRLTAILASTLAVLLLGGYFTFLNLPNLSLRVAATEAGIAANFPGYTPSGYSFDGPITYSSGAVAINFKSQSDKSVYTLRQEQTSWDSKAVLDNYVTKQTDSYLTYEDNGITIYAFGNNAAWVNGGLLYTLQGSAHLTSDQILSIATSM